MKIFVKGILCAEDVKAAIAAGCDGVIISNHGGRQLDGVPGTIDVLEECVDAAKDAGPEFEIHVDGGFRRGTDVFVALALGARCVWVGRPTIWGLAYDGQKGVERMLEIFYEDFRRCMAILPVEDYSDGWTIFRISQQVSIRQLHVFVMRVVIFEPVEGVPDYISSYEEWRSLVVFLRRIRGSSEQDDKTIG